jgi:hypothetical protein
LASLATTVKPSAALLLRCLLLRGCGRCSRRSRATIAAAISATVMTAALLRPVLPLWRRIGLVGMIVFIGLGHYGRSQKGKDGSGNQQSAHIGLYLKWYG